MEDHDHDELLPHAHDSDFDANWSPSWVMWLGLPRWVQLRDKERRIAWWDVEFELEFQLAGCINV